MNAKFIILGSSSGLPQANRASSGYVLQTGDSLSLFDCGGGVTNSFLKRGLDPLKVDRIFISHTHPDHCCELPLFIQLIYLTKRTKPLDLYLPEEFIEQFKNLLNINYMFPDKLNFELRFNKLSNGFQYISDEFMAESIANSHLKRYEAMISELDLPNKMECYSFIITVGSKKLFYSADIGSFEEIKNHLDDCDIVLIESSHIDYDQFLDYAADSKVEQFIITHIKDEQTPALLGTEINKRGLTNVSLAIDGLELGL